MSSNIELEGMEELLSKLEQMGTKTANSITKEALTKAGEYEANEMEKEAPRRSGDMSESIKVSNIKTKNGTKYVEVSPDKDHFYYFFNEKGTKNMSANPFMARTIAKTKKELKEIIKEELKRGLGL